jgi:PEP-CTERM motif-containing protein
MSKHLLPGAALIGLVSGGASAATIRTFSVTASTANPAPAGSTNLGTFNPINSPTGVGGIGGPVAFTAPITGDLVMKVGPLILNGQPLGFPGAVYQAFVDGTSLGFTDEVPLGGSQFSTGTFTTPISAGANTFNINDQIISFIGQQAPFGPTSTTVPPGFSPESLTVSLSEVPAAVPEPSTIALLAGWLAGLALFWRRRKTRPAVSA